MHWRWASSAAEVHPGYISTAREGRHQLATRPSSGATDTHFELGVHHVEARALAAVLVAQEAFREVPVRLAEIGEEDATAVRGDRWLNSAKQAWTRADLVSASSGAQPAAPRA